MSRRGEPVSKSRGIKIPPALKHGGYAASGLLPGEDAAAFEKLHRDLIDEIAPIGVLEEDIVLTMAQIIWRKQNLATFRLAKLARDQYDAIEHKPASAEAWADFDPTGRQARIQTAQTQVRQELGDAYALVEIGIQLPSTA